MEYLGNSSEENNKLFNIHSFDYYALLFSHTEKVHRFNLARFMDYTHTHVSMDDWGLKCNIEVKDGYIYVVRRPATDIARAFYVSHKDFNSNMKIMKIYFELTEKCILMDTALFTDLSEEEKNALVEKECIEKQKAILQKERIEYKYYQKVKCPLCRIQTAGNLILKVYGVENKCSVCLSNNVDIYLQSCKHACLCNDCCAKLIH